VRCHCFDLETDPQELALKLECDLKILKNLSKAVPNDPVLVHVTRHVTSLRMKLLALGIQHLELKLKKYKSGQVKMSIGLHYFKHNRYSHQAPALSIQ